MDEFCCFDALLFQVIICGDRMNRFVRQRCSRYLEQCFYSTLLQVQSLKGLHCFQKLKFSSTFCAEGFNLRFSGQLMTN